MNIPAWRTPHSFALIWDEAKTTDAFTYGPVAGDVMLYSGLTTSDVNYLRAYVGLEWLGSLADCLRPDFLPASAFTDFMADAYGITSPGFALNPFAVNEDGIFVARPFKPVPAVVIDRFRSEDGPRIRGFATELRRYFKPLTKGEPTPPDGLLRALDNASLPFLPTAFTNKAGEALGYGMRFTNLRDRALVELFDLYAQRATVKVCKACRRWFVPRRDEDYCRRYVLRSHDLEVVRGCVSSSAARPHLQRVHRQEYRRAWTQWKRGTLTDDEWEAWKREHNVTRPGRPSHEPDLILERRPGSRSRNVG